MQKVTENQQQVKHALDDIAEGLKFSAGMRTLLFDLSRSENDFGKAGNDLGEAENDFGKAGNDLGKPKT